LLLRLPLPPAPTPTLFPYTTLFRSHIDIASGEVTEVVGDGTVSAFAVEGDTIALTRNTIDSGDTLHVAVGEGAQLRQITPTAARSEEHTSELQSRENLVCRLLLEKK